MPELPDVEGFRRALDRTLPGRSIRRVRLIDDGILHGVTGPGLGRRLHGQRFGEARRRGKWLILTVGPGALLVHSGMTGHPYYADSRAEHEPYERLILELDEGEFRYADLRKLRGVWYAADDDAIDEIIGAQGPDALGISRRAFAEMLHGRRGQLKAILTDQSVIAGLGNMLSDEICWQARVNPMTVAGTLDDDEIDHLHRTMRRVLQTSNRHGCIPPLRHWLRRVRDTQDARCPRCGTPLERTRVRQRATLWCPHCQPKPR